MTAVPLDEAAVALLRDAIDALDEAAYATVAGEELDDVTAANLRVGIRTAIEAFVHELEDPAAAPDRSLFVAHGRAQYRAGRTLEEMLGFYQLSALTLWRRGADLGLRRGLPATATAALAEAIMRFVHELSVAAVGGYTEERAAGDRERLARRAQLFELLLGREPAAPDHVARVAEAAEWPLPARVVALALEAEPSLPWSRALTGTVDGVGCVLLAADDELEWHVGRLAGEAAAGGPIGRGEPVDWRAARASFEHAAAALRLARASGMHGVVSAGDHAAGLLLAADPGLARLLVERRLGPLLAIPDEARRERLTETLAAWLAHPDRPQAIADRLHLHVQSVRYRIGQLRETFGDALDDPDARFELAVALRVIGTAQRSDGDFIARR